MSSLTIRKSSCNIKSCVTWIASEAAWDNDLSASNASGPVFVDIQLLVPYCNSYSMDCSLSKNSFMSLIVIQSFADMLSSGAGLLSSDINSASVSRLETSDRI